MAADVVTKCRSSQPVHNAYAVVNVDMSGNMQKLAPIVQDDMPYISGFSDRFDTRFDDVRYYSGDTAS